MSRASVGLACLLALIASTAACGGTVRDPVDPNRYDPAQGLAIARSALLAPNDLPGDGWSEIERDAFPPPPDLPGSEACAFVGRMEVAVAARTGDRRGGRAMVSFEREGAALPVTVEATIEIYDDLQTAADVLVLRRTALAGGQVALCYRDALAESVAAEVSGRRVDPLAALPEGGAATAMEVTVESGGVVQTLRIETYAWTLHNASAQVTITGSSADVTVELVGRAVGEQARQLALVAR